MEQKQIEGKIFDLQNKLEIFEIALNEVNDCDELEPAYKDIIKAYREHISDLEEFLKLLPDVSGLLPSENLDKEWRACKKALDLKGTAGEMGIYFGMFMHGWRGRNTEGFWQ